MIRYAVRLINKDPRLDLMTKRAAVDEVLQHICHSTKKCHVKGLHSYHDVQVHKNHIAVAVDESSKSWHCSFGKILANEYRMRAYCDPRNEHRLFRWKDRN